MQRREAIRLFKEICKCIPDVLISQISLTQINRFKEDFTLRIDMALNDAMFKDIESIVEKYGMNLKSDKGTLFIHEPEPIEIMA